MANTTIHTTADHTVITAPARRPVTRFLGRTNTRLWVTQGIFATVFLFAGASKLVMPAEELTKNSDFSIEFLRFIGACELLGGIGLVLPALLRIRPALTPLAAAGLVVIMIGATIASLDTETPAHAIGPAIISALLAWVAVRRVTTNVIASRRAARVS